MTNKVPKKFDINANWTAQVEVQGWRHFRISGRRRGDGGVELELMAVCDRAVRFWVRQADLADPVRWRPGWENL